MHCLVRWLWIGLVLLPLQAWSADPREMRFPTPEFHPPRAERVVLENGMILYLMEDHELPLVTLQAMIRVGDIHDPREKIGLAGLTATVMRTGGTQQHRGDVVDTLLDQMAAHLSVGMGTTAAYATLDLLAKDLDRGLALFGEILMRPVFEEEKLTVAKNGVIEAIRRRNDHPGMIASREFTRLIYGPDHPLAWEPTEEGIRAIERKDLAAFHRRYFGPNLILLGVTGDFQREEMIRRIRSVFSGWPKKGEVALSLPPPLEPKGFAVHVAPKSLAQTQIRIGHLGIRQDNPDFFALSVLNDILGAGGFTSRLFKEVRTKRGLAYSAGSVLTPGTLIRGTLFAYAQTGAGTTYEAIATILEQIRKIREEEVSAEELAQAKEAFLNSFIFSFSSPHQIVSRQMSLEYYGLPSDFLEQYRDNVAKVTVEDIRRVARTYLHPEQLTVLVVGDEDRFDRPLGTLGDVRTISLQPEEVVAGENAEGR